MRNFFRTPVGEFIIIALADAYATPIRAHLEMVVHFVVKLVTHR